MPNWCANSLKITPTKPRAKTLMVRIERALEEANNGEGINCSTQSTRCPRS